MQKVSETKRRRSRGQSLVEVLVGSMVLIPIALFGIDLCVIVLANTANDSLAKTAARAAANQGSRQEANAAASKCVDQFKKSSLIVDVQLSQDFNYEKSKEVIVKTRMTVKLPAGVQGFDLLKFDAQAVAPVVAAPADV
ncbi:MAG: hypothetical protein K2X77_34155 [Candidatus Obscuribacterales bacterium]|jgi:Tfp pilus assembly protein PilV|nr:hypothetical protein [Candidatus Obscuribacterales bacterium]